MGSLFITFYNGKSRHNHTQSKVNTGSPGLLNALSQPRYSNDLHCPACSMTRLESLYWSTTITYNSHKWKHFNLKYWKNACKSTLIKLAKYSIFKYTLSTPVTNPTLFKRQPNLSPSPLPSVNGNKPDFSQWDKIFKI